MLIQRMTIKNGILYVERDNKFKISKVIKNHGYRITLKNFKTFRNVRWLIIGYETTEKEIIIMLPDRTVKRYQRNEWEIVHKSIHYF